MSASTSKKSQQGCGSSNANRSANRSKPYSRPRIEDAELNQRRETTSQQERRSVRGDIRFDVGTEVRQKFKVVRGGMREFVGQVVEVWFEEGHISLSSPNGRRMWTVEWENEDEYDVEEYTQEQMERIVYRLRPVHTRLATVDSDDEDLIITDAMAIMKERDKEDEEAEVREESEDNVGMGGMDGEYESDGSSSTLYAEDDSDIDMSE